MSLPSLRVLQLTRLVRPSKFLLCEVAMPGLPDVRVRTTTTETDNLPAPATKLVVTQYLKVSQDAEFWAWIIVGAFYDASDTIIWSTELFLAANLGGDNEEDTRERYGLGHELEQRNSYSDSDTDTWQPLHVTPGLSTCLLIDTLVSTWRQEVKLQ